MGMFDQQEKKTKLIIVHSQNTAVFANYLQLMITSSDDEDDTIVGIKDGSVETTIWSDKEYLAQKPSLSSNEHILFIGRGKIIPEECYGMETKFNKYGMTYGWLGKRAFFRVSKTPTPMKPNEIISFLVYAKQYDPSVNEEEIFGFNAYKNQLKRKGVGRVLKDLMLPGGYYNDLKDRIKSVQYRCLTIIFYKDKEGLSKFMNM